VLPENKDTKSSSEERLAQRLTENERLYISAQKLLRNEVSGNDQTSAQPLCVEQASSKYLNETTIRIEHRLLANHFHMGSTQDIIAEQTFDAMKLNSLLACLDILCGGSTILQEARKKAWPYCTAYIVEHLKDINPTKAPPEKRLDVVRRLLQLFRDPVTIAQWLEPEEFYTATNFPSDSHFIRSFVTWISDEFIQSSVSPQDLGWIQNALDAPHKNILAHFALGHANRWLKAMSKLDNLDSTFVVINSYLDLVRNTHNLPTMAAKSNFYSEWYITLRPARVERSTEIIYPRRLFPRKNY
jgi:hypothetical protein